MLLSGIYYGKTPIVRAYKSGEIIWNISSSGEQYLENAILDIKIDMIAYITASARELFSAEDCVEIQCYSLAEISNSKQNIVKEPLLCKIRPQLTVSEVNATEIQDDIGLKNNTLFNASLVIPEQIAANIIIDGKNITTLSPSELIKLEKPISFQKDLRINISDSQNTIVNIGMIDKNNAKTTVIPAENIILEQEINTVQKAVTNVLDSQNGIFNNPIKLNIRIEQDISPTENAVLQNNMIIRPQTNLNCLSSNNELIKEYFMLEHNSVLNSCKAKNGIIEQIATLQNQTEGNISTSINSILWSMGLIDADVHCLIQPTINSIINKEIQLNLDTIGTISSAEIIKLNNNLLIQGMANTQISKETFFYTKQDILNGLIAYAHTSNAVDCLVNSYSEILINNNIINLSNEQQIKIYNMYIWCEGDGIIQLPKKNVIYGDQIVSLTSKTTELQSSDEYQLIIKNTAISSIAKTNIHLGIIFKTLVNTNVLTDSQMCMNTIMPIDLILSQGLQCIANTILTDLTPMALNMTQLIQSDNTNNLTLLAPLKLLFDNNIQNNQFANLTSQIADKLIIENQFNLTPQTYLTTGISQKTFNSIIYNQEITANSQATLLFWQMPIQINNNLFIRQVAEIDTNSKGVLKLF